MSVCFFAQRTIPRALCRDSRGSICTWACPLDVVSTPAPCGVGPRFSSSLASTPVSFACRSEPNWAPSGLQTTRCPAPFLVALRLVCSPRVGCGGAGRAGAPLAHGRGCVHFRSPADASGGPLQFPPIVPSAARCWRVAPGTNTERKVKVPLEPRQMESNTEGRGGPARTRSMEAVGAARNRAKAKRRKACEPWVSRSLATKPKVCRSAVCIGDGIRVKFCVSYPGRSAGLRGDTVAAEDERTRR